MIHGLEFWYALSPRVRGLTGIIAVALILGFCWWALVLPGKTEQLTIEAKWAERRQECQTRWQELMNLKPPIEAEQINSGEGEAFSPLLFQSSGRQLIRWQPTASGGEMALAAQWAEVPQTFIHLAERNMRAAAFSLEQKESGLHFTLQLERDHGR